jgi:hypothetical protein
VKDDFLFCELGRSGCRDRLRNCSAEWSALNLTIQHERQAKTSCLEKLDAEEEIAGGNELSLRREIRNLTSLEQDCQLLQIRTAAAKDSCQILLAGEIFCKSVLRMILENLLMS